MAETEIAEVSSSTDVIPSCTSADDFLVSGQNEALVEAVSSITSSDMGHVVLTTQPHIVQDNQVVSSGIQQVVSSGIDHILVGPDGQLTIGGGGGDENRPALVGTMQDQVYAATGSDQIVLTSPNPTMPSSSGISTVSLDNSTLQGLLAGHGATTHLATANGETIQIIAVSNQSDLTGPGKFWQMLPGSDMAAFIAVNQQDSSDDPQESNKTVFEQMESADSAASSTQVVDMVPVSTMPDISVSSLISSPCSIQLPPGCPAWAARLKDCEVIGDSFRGWVESEVELDLLLTYHKQQTQSFWGTRQSPSPAKQSTRLMWKSQYVPFDGIPFVNAGSRAVVMECQYGPRRKGSQLKKPPGEARVPLFRQTCPARIYIKKVRKYPEFAVDVNMDKKSLKMAMDKAFESLKKKGTAGWGQERHYVQLPTEKAHEFHTESDTVKPEGPCRLHPRVAQKIREIVAGGEMRLYAVRKALRRFVEKQLFDSAEAVPEKHNLTYYPTVNDLQNHIHQAINDLKTGALPVTAHTVNVEVNGGDSSSDELGHDLQSGLPWQVSTTGEPHAETVTVTLTQNPGADGQHIISRVETHMSDGSTQVSSNLTPETAQLLSKLHPNMFPAGSLVQLQQQNLLNAAISATSTGQEQTITMAAVPPVITEHQQETVASVSDTDMLHVAAGDEHDEDISSIDPSQGEHATALIAQEDDGQNLVSPGMATLQIVHTDVNDGHVQLQALEGTGDSQIGGRLVTVTMGADGCLTLLDGSTLATVAPDISNFSQVKMEEDDNTQ